MKEVPNSLRTWFVIHFIADMLFGIPLLFFPEFVLPLLGWGVVDPISTRVVGAALMGIGIEVVSREECWYRIISCNAQSQSDLVEQCHSWDRAWDLARRRKGWLVIFGSLYPFLVCLALLLAGTKRGERKLNKNRNSYG